MNLQLMHSPNTAKSTIIPIFQYPPANHLSNLCSSPPFRFMGERHLFHRPFNPPKLLLLSTWFWAYLRSYSFITLHPHFFNTFYCHYLSWSPTINQKKSFFLNLHTRPISNSSTWLLIKRIISSTWRTATSTLIFLINWLDLSSLINS